MARTSNGMEEAAKALYASLVDAPAADVEAACKEFWQTWGTLPSKPVNLPKLRRDALRTLRAQGEQEGRKLSWIARHWGIQPNRFSKLTSLKREEAAA